MQVSTREFQQIIKENVKAGPYREPTCIVEVDKLSFVPGRIETITLNESMIDMEKSVERVYIDGVNGLTLSQSRNAVFPVQGLDTGSINSGYGGARNHKGVDILPDFNNYPNKQGMGTPIVASWGGVVTRVDTSNKYTSYGDLVEIVHSDTLKTRYAHLQKPLVAVGDEVAQGQVIGLMGNTGSVRSQGKPVTGSYDHDSSMRSMGYGTHLHFEIMESNDGGSTYRQVNPMGYLEGSLSAPAPVKQTGEGVVHTGVAKGYQGNTLHSELFKTRNWFQKGVYSLSAMYKGLTKFEASGHKKKGNTATTTFPKNMTARTAWLDIDVNVINEATLDFVFSTNLTDGDNDKIRVEVQDRSGGGTVDSKYVCIPELRDSTGTKIREFTDIYIPAGTDRIRIMISYGGKSTRGKFVKLGKILVREIAPSKQSLGKHSSQSDMSSLQGGGAWHEIPKWDFVLGENKYPFDIPTGHFEYEETMVLDNVQTVDVVRTLDQDTATLSMTLSNPEGFYSPEYNPYYFPEIFKSSPYAQNHGGIQTGVLSYNAPVRVYMGYGSYMIRVFTGTVDTIDSAMSGSGSTLQVSGRDMYKLVTDKVLTETKGYPIDGYMTDVSSIGSDGPQTVPTQKSEFIEFIGNKAVAAYAKSKVLPSIAIAQAGLESGWGEKHAGNNIYGVKKGSWTGKTVDTSTQEFDGSGFVRDTHTFRAYDSMEGSFNDYLKVLQNKRYAPVRNATNYKTAAMALQSAGYATDPKYGSKLIDIIEQHNLQKYDNQALGKAFKATSSDEVETPPQEKILPEVPWLKSAVIRDLIQHAGMIGWRRSHSDLQHPDAVIEESYVISLSQESGTYVRALTEEELSIDGRTGQVESGINDRFEEVKIDATPTPKGWLQPYVVEHGLTFPQYQSRVSDCIDEVLKDTHYRTYCDRYGTFRMETLRYDSPVVAKFTEGENLAVVNKSEDFSRARSHIMVTDEVRMNSFYDKEMMIMTKGEVRTSSVVVPWATTWENKKMIAERMFQDMKRLARTMTVEVVCNPSLELLDRIIIIDKHTATNSEYIIKGITLGYDGKRLTQTLDLFWAGEGTVI